MVEFSIKIFGKRNEEVICRYKYLLKNLCSYIIYSSVLENINLQMFVFMLNVFVTWVQSPQSRSSV